MENQRSNANDGDIAKIRELMKTAATARESIYKLLNDSSQQNVKEAHDIFEKDYLPSFNQIGSIMEELNVIGAQREVTQKQNSQTIIINAWILLAATVIIAFFASGGIIYLLAKAVLTPVREIESAYKEMSNGNLHVQILYNGRDELGRMANSIRDTNALLISYIDDISDKLEQFSRGDMNMSVDLDYIGDFSSIKTGMIETTVRLNRTMHLIRDAASQVNTSAGQIAGGAQALSSGATEQAATIEQLNASISSVFGSGGSKCDQRQNSCGVCRTGWRWHIRKQHIHAASQYGNERNWGIFSKNL